MPALSLWTTFLSFKYSYASAAHRELFLSILEIGLLKKSNGCPKRVEMFLAQAPDQCQVTDRPSYEVQA